ncbi:homoserine dehydrogenase [Prosthecomicrobium hirschii]|uniref:homoserine dehydrogenase n=1 Tax=Prosthecodimorpha hirschii TaxID=665126 RepID=UPI00112CBED7|nr:homoserine dehydrogenase [Prosthecomicrobium hirschii]TPQ50497.1 homoserine dehydrogenase [Prosthecomicrobium hirschii]
MQPSLRLGLAGLGTVGASVVRLLNKHSKDLAVRCGRPIVLRGVSARDRTRDRGIDIGNVNWFQDPVKLAMDPGIDVFVELMGGSSGPAEDAVRAALETGKHVVTANKALLARHGNDLARLAERKGVSLNFEAAVAGGIPVIKTLREALAGNSVSRVAGILNGTCNYILTRMEAEDMSFGDCLKEAQRLGYAEADPTFDVGGFDAAHKLALLTSLAFGSEIDVDSIYIEGIERITLADIEAADELGYRLKLLGIAERTESGIEQRVHPTMVPKASAIARIDGVLNAVAIDGDFVGRLMLVGPGAGGDATASSVVGDIADIARGTALAMMGRPSEHLEPYRPAGVRAHKGGYYVRLSVFDRPGALAAIAGRMAEKGISLESIVQRRRAPHAAVVGTQAPAEPQSIIMITYETTEAAVREALDLIRNDGHVADAPQFIRIEAL